MAAKKIPLIWNDNNYNIRKNEMKKKFFKNDDRKLKKKTPKLQENEKNHDMKQYIMFTTIA